MAKKGNLEYESFEVHKGTLPKKCPKCKKGNLEYESFEVEGMYYPVYCQNEDCNAKFWESPESKEEWGETKN